MIRQEQMEKLARAGERAGEWTEESVGVTTAAGAGTTAAVSAGAAAAVLVPEKEGEQEEASPLSDSSVLSTPSTGSALSMAMTSPASSAQGLQEEAQFGKEILAMRRAAHEFALEQEDSEYDRPVYRQEKELLELVRQGNTRQILENRKNNVFPKYSRFINFSQEKTEEYAAVITIAQVARTAIEAGLTSENYYQVSGLYLRKIAAARPDAQTYREICWNAIVDFTKLVEESHRTQRSDSYIEECRQFIATNIFKKISVRDAAQALSLSPIYLERIFRQETGMTVGDYIQHEKIERAKNLLTYSDRSLIQISDYLGFSSQSYFGKVFRKETGMTPRQYQKTHRMSKF